MRIISFLSLILAGVALGLPISITLDGSNTGRTFEGIGAVSAGASSRLLIDYPEPQRSQILDYLFKPGYGAALQHLKVEIGGGVNSTDGTEPTHMRTRTDENYTRGYEWWLMKEARIRNPNIILDCLAWGAPGWIGNGNYYSQDMADYVVKFLKAAKQVHGLDINYTGIANERYYDTAWIKLLRRTLDANGLNQVGIVVADQGEPNMIEFATPPSDPTIWGIAEEINRDPELKAAVAAIGGHYPFRHRNTVPASALASGLPLWSSEDGPWSGDWLAVDAVVNRLPLQASYNENYIRCKITKTEIWSPISSYYDILPVPGSGLMRANTPWSGHYDVQAAIWATAHTTQFTSPGWTYLEGGASALLPQGGSIVTLKSPNNADYSSIVETSAATQSQTVNFYLANGMSSGTVHVWQTTSTSQFTEIGQVSPVGGNFTYTFEPGALYTLSTTTGQGKGGATPPASVPFPLPFKDDFEFYGNNATPKYFSDQTGTFETVTRADGQGKALRQVELQSGIRWTPEFTPPLTLLGDASWKDYEVSSDVLLESTGFVFLYGRVDQANIGGGTPPGYWLAVNNNPGVWELRNATGVVATGSVSFATNVWHQLRLAMQGSRISGYVDGTRVCSIEDFSYRVGMAGLGSGIQGAQFDNFSIRQVHNGSRNFAIGAVANASSSWSSSFLPSAANDGNFDTRWNVGDGATGSQWLELNFPTVTTYNRVTISQFFDRITGFVIQHWDGSVWRDDFTGGTIPANGIINFGTVSASKMRILITASSGSPSIYELGVYDDGPPANLSTAATATALSSWSSGYSPNLAIDGNPATRWNSSGGTAAGEWLQLAFPAPVSMNQVALSQFANRITAYKIQYWTGSAWTDAFSSTANLGTEATLSFPTVASSRIRLLVVAATDTPSISEFKVFNQPAALPLVSINEWMVNNTTTLHDSADGQYQPWFELYNAGATNVDLSGYYLSSSAANPTQFQIPSGYTIPAGGSLLVWADGQPGQNSSANAGLHVNFSISNGTTLRLLTPQGRQVDSVTLSLSGADVAEGSRIDGETAYGPLVLPTPGNSNSIIKAGSLLKSATGASLAFNGLPYQPYRIQASTDLVTWSDLSSGIANASGSFQFHDAQAAILPKRFYRAVSP